MEFRKRDKCPCCNFSLKGDEKIFRGDLDANVKKKVLRNVWMGIGKTKHFTYLKCSNCGTLYNIVYPSESLLNSLYKNMPANMDSEVNTQNQIKNQVSYAKYIYKVLNLLDTKNSKNSKNSFLEVGADRGLLIKELKNLLGIKFKNCIGIEPNNVVLKELKYNLDESSTNSRIYSDINDLDKEYSNKFNLSACIHILDHCYEPKELLSNLNNKLKSNGILLIVVHNPESTLAKVLGRKWPPYCSQHPQLFTKKGILKISESTGFEVVKKGRTFNNFALSMITKFFGFKINFANNINLKMPLGNMYYILRKKSI